MKPDMTFVQANPDTYKYADRPIPSIDMIIIHTMEGTYNGTVSWFKKGAKAATQFAIARDGRMTQFMRESDIAYHAGNWPYNVRSIGIELEGALNPYSQKLYGFPPNDFPTKMLGSLVLLTRYLCATYPNIIPNRSHIIGHNEVPHPKVAGKFGGNDGHQDPGLVFPWDAYMASIQ